MAVAHILGYPSLGERRALKFALEAFWKGDLSTAALQEVGKGLREQHWKKQAQLGFVTTGDFTFYDHVLDHAVMLCAVPERFGLQLPLTEQDYFSLALGSSTQPAMAKAQWFGTASHYVVPELDAETRFSINVHDFLSQLEDAEKLGRPLKPVLLGPVSFLYLSRAVGVDKLDLLDNLAEQYALLLRELYYRKIEWLQIDEPIFALDLDDYWLKAFERAYAWFRTTRPKLLLATYFANVARYQGYITYLPFDGIHIDLVHAPQQLAPWLNALPGHWVLSAGIVDGGSAMATDLQCSFETLRPLGRKLGERLWVAPNCSLRHTPMNQADTGVPGEVAKSWLALADQKLEEVRALTALLNQEARAPVCA